MKTCAYFSGSTVVLIFTVLFSVATSATTFQTDTFIAATDFSNDGQDIIVTNCTLTIDGVHGFNSLQVLNGGVVTHSPDTYGPQQITFFVSNEPQVMNSNTPATLDNTNVDTSSIMVMDSSGTILYTEDVDYTVTVSNQFLQLELTATSSISNGATVLVSYDWDVEFEGFSLAVSNNVQVAIEAAIDLSGKGYGGGNGFGTGAGASQSTNHPFTFTAGGGGGHGGCGGMSSTSARGGAAYDSTVAPGVLGSGGGTGSQAGGSGGGVGQLSIGGTLELDGSILADGLKATNSHAGGGAGGSIFISASTIAGAGTISANGGNGETPDGGGGGGGRIAIYFGSNNFTGSISTFGGSGVNYGGAGTIYLEASTNTVGQLTIANNGQRGTNTFFSPTSIGDLDISGGAIAQAQLPTYAVSNLFLGSNSTLVTADGSPLTVTVNGNATIESNAAVSADLRSPSGSGNGGTSCSAGSGGGYGGLGGSAVCGRVGGGVYGSITLPLSAGSPGGGPTTLAQGGGLINLTVANTLELDGSISANGGASIARANGGGGSGGGILLNVGTLSGAGAISANGGASDNLAGGGGGGGRVAVYYDTNSFTGSILARGGAGTNAGGAGTVYLQGSNSLAQLIIDNGGLVGFTALPAPLASRVSGPLTLTISGGAVLTNYDSTTVILSSLFIGSNSFLASASSGLTATATNTTIQPDGGITLDGAAVTGASGGQTLFSTGGGGGNGGYGGMSASNALGGVPGVGSITFPISSGGVGGTGNDGPGGMGGGTITLTVPGTLQLDGRISANGVTGPGFNSGGGAGGSINMTVGTLAGAGTISAIGGNANNLGGGGGGGRIAVNYVTNLFAGMMVAPGGAGANNGGAGTVYLTGRTAQQQLIVDNGGVRGAITPYSGIANAFNLTVTGGAVLSNTTTTLSLYNLFIGSNSTVLEQLGYAQSPLTVLTNATIQSGGNLSDDGASVQGAGTGQTLNQTGGGGGYGGMGGNSLSNALGGTAVSDGVGSPSNPGSRGGTGFNQGAGGNGGGALRVSITGTLQLDGKISADGATGQGLNSGGGSGGSVYLTVGKIFGAGLISANGGAGNAIGGGGGGGRIAVTYSTSNGFAGTFSAHGGAGGNSGGAGTVFLSPQTAQPAIPLLPGGAPLLVVDNGGLSGANTPIFNYPLGIPYNFDLIITNGAKVVETNLGSSVTLRDLIVASNSTYVPFASTLQKLMTVQSNVIVLAGGRINGDGQSSSGQNPGQTLNATGGGGGHGGSGGSSISNALGGSVSTDQITEPTALGSRGGSGFNQGFGGNGGGALHMTVGNLLQVDGKISVDGVSGSLDSGAGSGGSLWISANQFKGAGMISANGGSADNVGGGGGGGRIAIVASRSNLFTGTLTARGGAGANYGGAGTILTSGNPAFQGPATQLVIDNGGIRGANTLISDSVGGANLVIGSGASVTVPTQSSPWNSLTVSSNAFLGVTGKGLVTVKITSNAVIQPGGAILLDGEGYPANTGPGFGAAMSGGGGHGGYGSASETTSGGLSYDQIPNPSQPGSGGGSSTTNGSAGGAALQLFVGGTLTDNGRITANGTPGIASGAGGGAGGTLWLNAATLAGAGTISANGGDGEFFGGGGGGGGGRIAVYFNSNQFAGNMSADGGAGFVLAGGAGTIYLKTNSINTASIILDNGGNAGTNTSLDSLGSDSASPVNLSVANGAVASDPTPIFSLMLQNLFIGNGGEFVPYPKTPLYLGVQGNATISSNGAIVSDFLGNDNGAGAGTGGVDFVGYGSGGGYGGVGGMSAGGAPGGLSYGSSNQPVDLGSPGGISPALAGFSQGGGAIRLSVGGTFLVNGTITANGADAFVDGSGGGSGGSIWITAQSFLGNGSLTANGGAGESTEGGGGGGGRIAIYSSSNSFAGNVLANGGAGGWAPGQNGTIFYGTNLIISGIVADTTGAAVSGVSVAATGAGVATSDANGLYSIPVPLFWSGTLAPSGAGTIVPSSQSYVTLSTNAPDQNFVVASTSAFLLSCGQCDGTNVDVGWYGISGASYQVLCSTDLVNWLPYGDPIAGTNGPAGIEVPVTNAPQLFFQLNVNY